jgi:murein peptide amidase A
MRSNAPSTAAFRRHGNRGGYAGERVEIASILGEIVGVAGERGWEVERFGAVAGLDLIALARRVRGGGRSLYVSAGIHGDEPAGPLAVLELLRQNHWPADADMKVIPCLNPTGFRLNRRANEEGLDLNRDYRALSTAEVRAHVGWLERQPGFDCALCLHEDWEAQGFYLYELNPDGQPSRARQIVEAVAGHCPIESAEMIDGWPALSGIIRPEFNPEQRKEWPEAVYLVGVKTRHSYTLEAPSDYPLDVRVNSLVTGAHAALELNGSTSTLES